MPAQTARFFAIGQHSVAVLVIALACGPGLSSVSLAQEKSTADFRAYRLQHIQALQVEERLQEMLGALAEPSEVAIDRKTNRVLVRGNPEAQRLAAQLLGSLDRPVRPATAINPVQSSQPTQSELKTYSLPSGELEKTVRQLQQKYKNVRGISISSDPRTLQLLVTAPTAVHAELAKQLAPPKAQSLAKRAPKKSGSVRRVQFEDTGDLESDFEQAVANEPVADESSQNEPVFDEVNEAERANPIRQRPQPTQPQATQSAPTRQPVVNRNPTATQAAPARDRTEATGAVQEYRLRKSTAAQFETALQQLVHRPLQATVVDGGRTAGYLLKSTTGQDVNLRIDRKTGNVSFAGPRPLVENWLRLVQALDTGEMRGSRTKAVAFEKSDPNVLRRVLVALQQNAPAAGNNAQRQAQPRGAADRDEDLLADPDDQSMPADDNAADAQEQAATPGGNLIGSVQIEFLEGLDVIVVRGHPRDVQRVTEIIADIERLSTETEPTIEIVPLRYVGSEPLAVLIRQLYEQVLLPRQGKVNITALGKPNALLLIGREESVKTVITLVKKLDQPAGPASQFQVYGLKHIAAGSAQTIVQEFFANRIGLDTKVLITSDARSNALIVQASPRDLAEVSALIKRIDISTSNAINELRIFPLQNSLADEMAPILQSAVSGQTATTTARRTTTTGGPQGANQGGAPGAAGAGAAGSQQKSTMLRLLTLDAQGEKRLKSGILNDVRVTADPRANALIVSAPADSMELLAALIKQLDQLPTAESQLKVFTIVNGDASTLTEMLRNLFGRTQQQGQGQQFGQGANVAAAGALGQGESPLVPLRFSVDQRTNSIVVSGSAGDLNVVEAILLRLDDSDVRQRKNVVYRLKNSPATAVANAVNEFLRSERQVQQISPGLQSPFEQIEREVVVVPETVSNSLIVSATPRFFEEIRKVVEQLDARPPMVMIQVLIAEVALNNVDEFGIELGLQDSILFDRSLLGNLVTTNTSTTFGNPPTTTQTQTIVAASNTPGYAFNNAPLGNSGSSNSLANSKIIGTQGLSNFGVGRINNELGFGGMVLSASSESVSMLVRALQECRRLDVLSRPQIMTLDNQPAFIQVGQRVPRITGTTLSTNGQSNAITLENVGLILGVTPRISPDGLVVMEIDATKSDVGPDIEGIPVSISATGDVIRSPRINITTAQTTVSALSGQTVVLGGLIFNSKQQTHRRVPVLSSIPVLGNLFRYDSATNKRTELLIIMTPRVVRTEQEAETIKQVEAARMSWCLADVVKLYGEAGLRNRSDNWFDNETMTVYPDINPTGVDMPQLAPETMVTPPASPGVKQPPLPNPVRDAPEPDVPAGDPTPPVIESPGRKPTYLPDPRQSRLVTPAVKKVASTAPRGAAVQSAVYNSVDTSAAEEPRRLPSTLPSR